MSQMNSMFSNEEMVQNMLNAERLHVPVDRYDRKYDGVLQLLKEIVDSLGNYCQSPEESYERQYASELIKCLETFKMQQSLNSYNTIINNNNNPIRSSELSVIPFIFGKWNMGVSSTNHSTSPQFTSEYVNDQNGDETQIRFVGLQRVNNEPLGITVRTNDNNELEIAKIIEGGMIDRHGMLHIGDIIKEVNGIEVESPDDLKRVMNEAETSITFKVIPSYYEMSQTFQKYVKAYFSYNPSNDKLIPSKNVGLSFNRGDILHIISQEDIHWWQACLFRDPSKKGLIPSRYLEERRKAFVEPYKDISKVSYLCGLFEKRRKKKELFSSKNHSDLDNADLILYEEVARMPPFKRRTLILIGTKGSGRRTIKSRLMEIDPERFDVAIPFTSRPIRDGEENGIAYYFSSREQLEQDIANNEFLEWGDYNDHIYGTKFETIRQVIRTSRMCIIDCSPQSLKFLCNSSFMPFVVFLKVPKTENLNALQKYHNLNGSHPHLFAEEAQIAESEQIEQLYGHKFDLILETEDPETMLQNLLNALDALDAEPQWVPVSWIY